MNAEQKDLRLPDFDNEYVEIVAFSFGKMGKRSWDYPTQAEFLTGMTGAAARATVFLFQEDHRAFMRAEWDIRGHEGDHNPPISVLIRKDRIASIKSKGGAWVDVNPEPATDRPALHVVNIGAPAVNEENGPTPLVVVDRVEPAPMRKSSDDGGAGGFTPGKARLYAKIAKVMGDVNPISERGMSGQGYSYATDADMFNVVRNSMSAANLAMLPVRLLKVRAVEKETFIDLEFTLADGDTGETIVTPWIGKLSNNTDKAIHACMTMCTKYFLKYTFLIATAGDEDADKSAAQANRRNQSPAPKKAEPEGKADPLDYIRLGIRTGTAIDDIQDREIARLLGIDTLTLEAIKAKHEGKTAKEIVQIALDTYEAEQPKAGAVPEAAKSDPVPSSEPRNNRAGSARRQTALDQPPE